MSSSASIILNLFHTFTHLRSRKSKPSARSLIYTKSGCPAFLGCLWDVTDVDIDIFTIEYIELLKSKLQTTAKVSAMDTELLEKASKKCKLRYLNGSAFIMYGLPIIQFSK